MYAELAHYIAPKGKAVQHNIELMLNMSAFVERLREGRRRVAEMRTIDVKAIPEPEGSVSDTQGRIQQHIRDVKKPDPWRGGWVRSGFE
jgi:hypothetical protein